MKRTILSMLASLLLAASAHAQVTLNEKTITTLVKAAADSIEKKYVFPDKGKSIANALKKNLSSGKYKKITDPFALSQTVTADIRSIVNDKHMGMVFAPNAFKAMAGDPQGPGIEMFSPRINFSFAKVEVLEGNIGYIKFDGFPDNAEAYEVAAAAIRFVSNTDALIIDLRENGGGSDQMIAFLCSYFFDKPVHINSFYNRLTNDTTESWTKKDVPGKRMTNTPLFILTSDYTFSAAEEMSYDLQALKRATIIGETTGGGAHPVERFLLTEGFIINIPTGRAINPITKTNWEGTGVSPDIKAKKEEAFDIAYIEALEAAAAKAASPRIKDELNVLAAAKKAALAGFSTGIEAYAGVYGIRTIRKENGKLFFRREQGPEIPLLRISENEFIMDDMRTRIKFVKEEGGKLALEIVRANGEVIKAEKTGS